MSFDTIKSMEIFCPQKDYGDNTIIVVEMPTLVRYKTAQKYYGVSRSKLERMVEESRAACKVGDAVWIDRIILEDFIRAHNIRTGIALYPV